MKSEIRNPKSETGAEPKEATLEFRPGNLCPAFQIVAFRFVSNFGFRVSGFLFCLGLLASSARANPQGGTVGRGSVSFNNKGPQLTINASSGSFIQWQSFNIGVGETTRFIQPSSSSVVWNQINDPNPSQILGTLNANGYVVLQNQSGFFIGGQATISAHGLVMTTTPIVAPSLWSGGAWSFNTPPPTARIVNYGQVTTDKGGSVFLIAHDIENHGTISAPGGQIGLYAGKQVMVSERPDGRGLSAQVTLPEGSVDNEGKIIADAGTIAMHAKVVNQGGLVQANSLRNVNGTIELVASDALNLGPNSVIQAKGGDDSISSGGSVLIKSDKDFSDQPGSVIDISGGKAGGQGGQVEISAGTLNGIQSTIDGHAAEGFKGGNLILDPYDITIDDAYVSMLSPIVNKDGLYGIELQADHDIKIGNYDIFGNETSGTFWILNDPGQSAILSLTAGRNITLGDGSGIIALNNWSVSLTAGTELTSAAQKRTPGSDGIYLQGNAFIQTINGNINLTAGNEIIVDDGSSGLDVSLNGITTVGGGSITAVAKYGDINTGGNFNGYNFGLSSAPYYSPNFQTGGISTTAGGDVTLTAGGNITSYLPTASQYGNAQFDGGSGAFGPQPGNVTITAGGSVYGHYVLANGVGTITAENGNVGVAPPGIRNGFALSLVKGNWGVFAPNGNIYVQDLRNPNGIFNDAAGDVTSDPGYHYFDYDPHASVLLFAKNSVEITGAGAPHSPISGGGVSIPILLPPTLRVIAGSDLVLDTDVTLFPSPYGDLSINVGGNFQSYVDPANPKDVNVFTFLMSDSAATQWNPNPPRSTFGSFKITDHAAVPPELNNPQPVEIYVGGSMNNLNLYTDKETDITVGKDMFNSGVIGQNLHPTDVTSISVAGKISYPPTFTFTTLPQAIVGADPLHPNAWDSIFSLMVDPTRAPTYVVPANATLDQIRADAQSLRLVLNPGANPNPGFVYDAATKQLGFKFQMSEAIRTAMEGPLQIIKLDKFGNPMVQNGHFVLQTVTFAPTSAIETLYTNSKDSVVDASHQSPGFQIGGPGRLEINAGSVDLGSSSGIISWGRGNGSIESGGINYASLYGLTPSGASIKLNVAGDLSMLTSTIASIDGGDVTVNSGGKIDLSLGQLAFVPVHSGNAAFGIYTSGHSDVSVTADKNINIGSARIATFNGGDIFVESLDGTVNAGNGANTTLVIPTMVTDPNTGAATFSSIQNPKPFGSGIVAISPSSKYQVVGSDGLPGNITVETPHGDIVSTLGGIQQFALNGDISGGPTITLTAGTPATDGSPAYKGNVDLGAGGVIGGTVNITAQGNIEGLIVTRQNANINAAQTASITLLAGGTANVAGGTGVVGTIAGINGVNVSGSGITASLLGQNVSVGGATAQSTLGTSAATTSTSQAAAQQASSGVQEQVGNNQEQGDDAKKKKGKGPILTRRVGRVTVILPKT
jgi:filamentous hemagglutinin family protein